MKKLLYLIVLLVTCFILVTCKKTSNDNENPPSSEPTADVPIFKEGDIVNSEFLVDDVLREQMIDTAVNLGSADRPALFWVNQSHTLDGAPLAIGNHSSNVFRSLTRQDLYEFIVLWGTVHGVTININDPSPESVARRQQAFYDLLSFLLTNDVDLPLLVSLSKNPDELQCAIKWSEAAHELSAAGVKLAEPNTPDNIFSAIEISGINLSDLSSSVHSNGMTEKDFLMLAQQKGIDLRSTLMQVSSPRQVNIVCLVALGVKMFTSWLLRFINHGTANPNLNNSYASYLNDNDSLVMNYYAQKNMISPTYTVKYASFVKASFYMETYYDAYHATLPGQYVNRIGMIVTSIKCTWGMHLDGTTSFYPGDYQGTENNPIAFSQGNVRIEYGDCCMVKRVAGLAFDVSGDTGWKEDVWVTK